MPRGLELQFRTRSRLARTEKGYALHVGFRLGPIAVFIIANLPERENDLTEEPLAYIKVSLDPDTDWPLFKDHSQTRIMPRHTDKKDTDNGC